MNVDANPTNDLVFTLKISNIYNHVFHEKKFMHVDANPTKWTCINFF